MKKIKKKKRRIPPQRARSFVEALFADDLHAKRVLSISNGVIGVLHSAALGVHAIGRGLAGATGNTDKHSVKQVDRLLSNAKVDVWSLAELWVPYVVGDRPKVFINLDWTEFDPDDHSMIVASVQTDHGRSTPVLWKTVKKSTLRGRRNIYEDWGWGSGPSS